MKLLEKPPDKTQSGKFPKSGIVEPRMSREETLELAQMAIEDYWVTGMAGLKNAFGELHDEVVSQGLEGQLCFKPARIPQSLPKEEMSAEQVRKFEPNGEGICEGMMFKLIVVECFGVGSGRPVIGKHRTTQVATLQNKMHRKLHGPHHKSFRRCWESLVGEGVIKQTKDDNAAYLDLHTEGLGNAVKEAVVWAIREQMKVSPEWHARFEPMFAKP